MGIWLYDAINLTGRSIGLQQGSSYQNLTYTTTTVDKVTGYQADSFVFYYHPGNTRLHVYDGGNWDLKIVLKQDNKPDLAATWHIKWNKSRYSFVFEEQRIWFYSTDKALVHDGGASDGWVVQLNKNDWAWEAYNIQPTRIAGVPDDAVVKDVGPAPAPPQEE